VSYLVLARKYRPRRFDDLVGQEHVARTLTNAIGLDRVHHAFLFTGARGVGKTSAARILAMALSCEKGPTPAPCGTCDICQEIVSGRSVDVLEIDGASNTGVDDVRTLREGVKYAPARARKKVYIIDEVHMLSTSAFNALLKTLEEPPGHVVFILATTEVHKIPATIMSRVQRYDFKLVPTGRLVQHLSTILGAESIGFEPDALRVVARQAGGSVRDALSLLDQVIAFFGDETLTAEGTAGVLGLAGARFCFELGAAVVARDAGQALRSMAAACDRGVDPGQMARTFLAFLHDVEMVGVLHGGRADVADVVELTEDEIAEAKALHDRVPRGTFSALFERWARAVEEGGASQAARLLYEMALVDLCQAEPLMPLGDLLERLESLEGRLGPGGPPTPAGPGPSAPAPGTGSRGAPPRPARPTAVAPSERAAPEPPRPAPANPRVSLDNPAAFWSAVKSAIESKSPMLASGLDHAEVTELVAGGQPHITITVADRFAVDHLEKGRPRIEAVLQDVAGVPLRLTVRQGQRQSAPGARVLPSAAAEEEAEREDERRRREDEARHHPMIQKAQNLFGANLAAIKSNV
jgi:DNA polymerase-3 subunit gamma/tau